MPFIEQLGQAAGGGILGIGLQAAGNAIGNAQSYRQQEKLQALGIRGSKEMTDYQNMKQLEIINRIITRKIKDGKDSEGNNKYIIQKIKIKDLPGYERDNQIATQGMRHFLEGWRKKFKKSVRHWMITELGHKGTKNIHLHGIIWTNEHIDTIRERWKHGYIWPRKENTQKTYVSNRTVNYIIKYITKRDLEHKEYKPKIRI